MDRKRTARRSNDGDIDTSTNKRAAPAKKQKKAEDTLQQTSRIRPQDFLPNEMLTAVITRARLHSLKEIARTFKSAREIVKRKKDFDVIDYVKLDVSVLPAFSSYLHYSLEIGRQQKKTIYDFHVDPYVTTIWHIASFDKKTRYYSLSETFLANLEPRTLVIPSTFLMIFFEKLVKFLPLSWRNNIKELIVHAGIARFPKLFIANIAKYKTNFPSLKRVSFDYNSIMMPYQFCLTKQLEDGFIIKELIQSYPSGKLNKLNFTSSLSEGDHKSGMMVFELVLNEPKIEEVIFRQTDSYTPRSIHKLLKYIYNQRFDESSRIEMSFDRIIDEVDLRRTLRRHWPIRENGKNQIIFQCGNTEIVLTVGCFVENVIDVKTIEDDSVITID